MSQGQGCCFSEVEQKPFPHCASYDATNLSHPSINYHHVPLRKPLALLLPGHPAHCGQGPENLCSAPEHCKSRLYSPVALMRRSHTPCCR